MHEDYPMLPPTVSIPRQASAYRLHRYTPTTTSNTDRSPGSTFDGCITTPASSTPLKMDRRSHRSSFSPDPDMGGMLSLPRSESQALMPTGEMDPLVRAVQWSARRSASAVELGGHVAQAATDERCHRISGRGTARPLRGSARDEDAPEVSERLDSTLHLSPSPREEQRSCTPPRVVPDVLHVQTSPNLYLQPTSPHHHAPTQAEATCTPNARGGRVAVVVRKRPVCDGETGEDCVRMSSPTLSINLMKQRADMSEYSECCDFSFDGTFDEAARNADIFASCGREMIEVALEGGSASFFGYGQGGSGKTHTMMGSDEDKGLYVLSAAAIFEQLSHSQHVSVAWYEVCSNALFDLLNHRTAVALCEGQGRRVEVSGLSWHRIHSANEVWRLIGSAEEQLRRGNTTITAHVVMSLKIERADSDNDCGMLNFVDLAGSERRTGTANDTQTRLDRAEISKSLFALKECFRAQDEKKRHVPFRGSRLTEVLRDAFMGNSKTIVVANISPSSSDCDATINTLRYACRVKGISVETVGPSKARSGQRTMPVSLRSRSAPSLPELATDSAASPTLSTPLAPRSPIMHSSNVVLPQTRGRDGRPPLKTESSPSIVPSTPSKYADDEEAPSPAGEAEEVDGRRKRSSFRQRFLHPLADHDNSTATTTMPCRPPSADLRGMEERLQAKIMQHLRQDLGSEIQTILDERDGLIAELRKENADLKAQLSFCQCGSPLMDEYFSPPPPPPPTRKPSKKQKRGGR